MQSWEESIGLNYATNKSIIQANFRFTSFYRTFYLWAFLNMFSYHNAPWKKI